MVTAWQRPKPNPNPNLHPNLHPNPNWRLGDGNRLATVLLYLTDVPLNAGGATVFTRMNLVVPVMARSAVFWYNLNPDRTPDQMTKHGGCVVNSSSNVKWYVHSIVCLQSFIASIFIN